MSKLFRKKIILLVFVSFILLFIGMIGITNAQAPIVDTSDKGYEKGDYQINDFIVLATRVAKFIWAISGSLALLAFIYGGFMFLISAGSSERVNKARQIITGAVVGLIIVFGSYTIVYFIMKNIFGIANNPMRTGWF
ncbi:MAG: hypothetical protein BWY51_00132 [Parcubacteria group bacterium ADurb.Bin316]|nr:MAG: hypothetical protein BWY51_00132 [Parcubacteria group bacterium ADurb.Bin316]HOZ55738.1 hypothetical protein [bacterium]